MAATVSSPWAKPGAWALDAEEHEAELEQQQTVHEDTAGNETADFPSLASAAADLKQSKKKKKKTAAIPLALYQAGKYAAPELTTSALPKGPRERTAEELDQIRGNGFRSYGMSSYRNGDDSSNSRWGRDSNSRSSGPRDRDSSREREPLGPSRADEDDDWSKAKKSPVAMNGNGFDRRERDRDRGSSFFESQSKADEASSWVSSKPVVEPRKFGGGFERRGSFDSLSRDRQGSINGGGSADSESWGRRREEGDGTGAMTARPKLVLQPRTAAASNGNESVAKPKGSSPFGDAKPRDEVLQQPRAVPVSTENELAVKPKSSNPFGSARPREEVLAEKGKDWKEIDEKLESVKLNSKSEEDKVERGDKTSRWSFGRVGSGETVDRSWRKPDSVDSSPRPQSPETVENGVENGHSDAVEHENGKQDENGTTEEN